MSKIDYFPDKYTTRSRRSQRVGGVHKYLPSPPQKKLAVEAGSPCGVCQIPYQCPIPNSSFKLPLKCMRHLMERHRTWACVYNIKSWCTYISKTHACFAQDGARETDLFVLVKEYRQAEYEYFVSFDGKRRPSMRGMEAASNKMLLIKAKIFSEVGSHNLKVCAFYPLYKSGDSEAVINATDTAIPKLLASGSACLKGERILV